MKAADRLIPQVATLTSPTADLSDIKVSEKSHIYDVIWDFTDDLEHRPRSINDSKLQVNWAKWPYSPPLRREMQRLFALYSMAPNTLSKRSREIKPNTLVMKIERSLDFICDAVQRFESSEMFDSLTQLELTDLQEAAKVHASSAPQIKQGLQILFHPFAETVLGRKLIITQGDIKDLPLNSQSVEDTKWTVNENDGPALFSDDLFAVLSDESISRVQEFIHRLGEKSEDKKSYRYKPSTTLPEGARFVEAFYLYEQMRRCDKGLSYDDMGWQGDLRHHLRKIVRVEQIKNYLDEVNLAAQCVIGLYVGPRFSELASFKVGCLSERDGVSCIIGRNFKGKRDKNRIDDAWVAIPAVRDAVTVLEKLAKIKNSKFLFSSLDTAGGKSRVYEKSKSSGHSYSNGGFRLAMMRFIKTVDKQGRYAGWKFNTHQFKHSIARQLIKVRLGLPYISFHLKHLHSRIATLPNDATLGYGNAAKILQSEMAGYQIRELKRELVRKMYDPDRPVHGGAAPEFDSRRKSYFKGMADLGMSKEQVIEELTSLAGSSFVNVGLGYCTGRKDDPSTGEKPPCIGNLRCNPNNCSNAIITKEAHGRAWQRIASENRERVQDPRFSYAKTQLKAAADEAEEVCRYLGMEVDNE